MKPGYHSTQEKIYGIKRSEFYGFVLGYATGTILRGIFNLKDNTAAIICAAIGVLIGIWWDRKYCMAKDEPEEAEEDLQETPAENAAPSADLELEGASTQETLKKMFERNAEDPEQE